MSKSKKKIESRSVYLLNLSMLLISSSVAFLACKSPISQVQQPQSSQPSIPYLSVLERAKIETSTLANPATDAIIQGNGDLHSFFYAKDNQLILHMAKNDVYDARIETAEDLPLAKIDISTGTTSRELTMPPSWSKPYPLSINYANLLIDFSGNQKTTLDIARSYASVNDGEILIRPLLQANVYQIHTTQQVRLAGQPWDPIPKAETGVSEGVKWVKQVLPPDDSGDWKGMTVVTALASKEDDHYLAVVTSLEDNNPMQGALTLAISFLEKDPKTVIRNHEYLWKEFWSKSGIHLSDYALNKVWYQNLYFSRCAQHPNAQAIGLFIGPLLRPLDGWHDNYTVNYNFQQTFWSFLNTNHVEYIDPYNKVILDYLPRAQWFAKQTYGLQGAFYPHNIFRHEPPHPQKCQSNNGRMFAGGPWAYTLGLSSFLMHNLWLSYKFQPQQEKLQQIYPPIRELTTFYVNLLKECPIDQNGKLRIGPTISPEHLPFGVYNCPFDIAFIRFSFQGFLEASEKLKVDAELAKDVEKYMALLPDYPIHEESGFVVDRENGVPIEYNIPVPTTPIFPAEQLTYFSPKDEKELFVHTLEHIVTNGNNSTVMLAVAKARLSTNDAMTWLKHQIGVRLKPNGSLNLSEKNAAFNSFGHYTEMFAISGAISELLMQSVDGVVRVFPAWPKEKDAAFTTLRAQGGFLVSAEQKDAEISTIEVVSTLGGKFHLLNPWKEVVVKLISGGKVETVPVDDDGIISFETIAGEEYILMSMTVDKN